jgi:hypothetical protein
MKDDAAFVDRCFDGCSDPEQRRRSAMSPVRLWFGLVFLAMGVLAILDATETIAWSTTFEEWWPLAVGGWGLAVMLGDRRVSLGGVIIVAIGTTLLADEQGWTVEALVWSMLFLIIGVAILLPGSHRKRDDAREDRAGSSVAPAHHA